MESSKRSVNYLKDRVKEARKKKGYTQQELADRVYVNRKAISDIENGWKSPNAILLYNLGIELGVSVDWLVGFSDNPNEEKINSIILGIYSILKKYPRDKQGIILTGMRILDN